MVGDHHTDIQAAKNARCDSVFVNYGLGNLKQEKPTYELNIIGGITRLLSLC